MINLTQSIFFTYGVIMPRVIEYKITEEYGGLKIYTFLKYRKGFSDRLIRSLKRQENGILLNGEHARTIELLAPGDILGVTLPESENRIEPIEYELDIVYEDDDILVINKPPFLAMHPTHNHQGDTLANAVTSHLLKQGKTCAFRAVGRLDKGTSGIVIAALNPLSAAKLNGRVVKEYCAVVKGHPEESGTVDAPIYRPDPMKTLRACSYEKGVEPAVTHWQVIKYGGDCSLIRLNLETGRTHQIRVHMAFIGHPLAGDTYYGDFRPEFGHQLLHCRRAELIHPVSGERAVFETGLPAEFERCLDE